MVDIDRTDHPGQHPFMKVPDLYEGWEPSRRPDRELHSGTYLGRVDGVTFRGYASSRT